MTGQKTDAVTAERERGLFAAIVANSTDAIVSKTLDGVITSWNPGAEELFGYTAAEAVGKPVTMLIPPERLEEEQIILARVRAGERLRYYETVRLTKAGRPVEVSLSVAALRDDAGKVVGAAKIARDITEKKAAERHLRQANEELEKFAYVAAHDLRAPLRNIDNLASWVLEDNKESLSADAAEKLALLRERVARLEKLLNDILAYSRAGSDPGAAAELDLQQLVQSLAETHVPPDFALRIPEPLPRLVSASLPLEQIFGNLLANAARHHDKTRGEIEVRAARQGNVYEFMVADDGPGIPPEYRVRVFEMFQTLKPRNQAGGSGMGMAIVKKLVEGQGGRAWVSEGLNGRGATVHFQWPAVPGSGPKAERSKTT
jgi:PAS domain S-box-containing protein